MIVWMVVPCMVSADGMFGVPSPEFFADEEEAFERVRELDEGPGEDEWCCFSYAVEKVELKERSSDER